MVSQNNIKKRYENNDPFIKETFETRYFSDLLAQLASGMGDGGIVEHIARVVRVTAVPGAKVTGGRKDSKSEIFMHNLQYFQVCMREN